MAPYLLQSDQSWVKIAMYCPTIETYTLAEGFTPKLRESLKKAISEVIRTNPILMGRVTLQNNCFYLVPNAFPLESHEFFDQIDVSDSVPSSFESDEENIQFIKDTIVPLVKHQGGTGKSEISNQSPLFSFTLFTLTDTIVCYKMSLSHLIGDASTYYDLMDQVDSILNRRKVKPINWNNPLAKTSTVTPDDSSERDIYRTTGPPLMLTVVRNLPSLPFRKPKCIFFDQNAVNEKKRRLVNKARNEFLSTNDIVMSAICRLNLTAKIVSMVINRRGRTEGIKDRDGGIFIFSPAFDPYAGKDPNVIREIVKKGGYYEPNTVPLQPYLQGKVCSVTNWATLTQFLNVRGMKTLCHMPGPAFFDVPMDGCVIFKVKDDCTAVCVNFPVRDTNDDSFLKDIIVQEKKSDELGTNELQTKDQSNSWLYLHTSTRNIVLASALTAAGAILVSSRKR